MDSHALRIQKRCLLSLVGPWWKVISSNFMKYYSYILYLHKIIFEMLQYFIHIKSVIKHQLLLYALMGAFQLAIGTGFTL